MRLEFPKICWLGVILTILLSIGAVSLVQVSYASSSSIPLLDVAWSPSGDLYAVIDQQGSMTVIDSTQTASIFQFAGASLDLFGAAVSWNPDGSLLAAGIGYQVYIWETTTWELVAQYSAGVQDGQAFSPYYGEELPEGILNITWSRDSRYVVSGSVGYLTTVWDNLERQIIYQNFDLSGGGPGRVWLGNGMLGDGSTLLNATTGQVTYFSPSEIPNRFGAGGGTNATDIRPDGREIAYATEFGYVIVYDLYTLRGIQLLDVADSTPPEPRRSLADVSWDGSGSFIAAVSRDGEIFIVNLETDEVSAVFRISAQLNAVDWNPTSNEIIYSGVNETGGAIFATVDASGIAGVPTNTPTSTDTPTATSTSTPTPTPTATPSVGTVQLSGVPAGDTSSKHLR